MRTSSYIGKDGLVQTFIQSNNNNTNIYNNINNTGTIINTTNTTKNIITLNLIGQTNNIDSNTQQTPQEVI